MKIYMMTDMEGVAGVLNSHDWCTPAGRYYEIGRELLTMEVNAAVGGLCEGGATEIHVIDGHGSGGISIKLLDPRVEMSRGWGEPEWPLGLDTSFDYAVWVGQHPKAGTPYGHLAHTQSFDYLDESINGISVGEFGQLAMCAGEIGVRAIFGSGDEAFGREAQALVPGIETVAVKRGLKPGSGDELNRQEYEQYVSAARHLHPERARRLIREGALRAIRRAQAEEFGIVRVKPPFERVIRLRPKPGRPRALVGVFRHPTSVSGVLNLWSKNAFRGLDKPAGGRKRERGAAGRR